MLISSRWRAAIVALATSLLAVGAVSSAPRASADDGPVSDCHIVDTSPDTVILGISPKRVQFDVGTDCDGDDSHDIRWSVMGNLISTSAHVGWFGACNYSYAGPSSFDCLHDGSAVLNVIGEPEDSPTMGNNRRGNQMAGQQAVYAYMFDDVNGNGRDDDYGDGSYDYATSSFTLLRQTTFGSSFHANNSVARRGRWVTFTGQVQRANWDIGRYEKIATYVQLQFQPDGTHRWQNVAWVRDDGTSASVHVRVNRSGSWRYSIPANDTDAASTSKTAHVRVR